MVVKVPLVIPVGSGLEQSIPVSDLKMGMLVQAINKAPGVWGPRHGKTFIDRETRGRSHAELNGSSSYLTIPYTSQLVFGRHFTVTMLWKFLSIPSTGESAHLLGVDDSSIGGIDCYISSDGKITAKVYDGSVTATLSGVSAISADDVVCIAIVRDGSVVRLMTVNSSNNVGVVQEAVSSVLSTTADLKDNEKDYILGKRPSYFSGSGFGYLHAVFGGMVIYGTSMLTLPSAFSELHNPRSDDVVGCWTGDLVDSNSAIFDSSSYGVDMLASNVSSVSRISEFFEPVQGLGYETLWDGKLQNLVVVGGRLFGEDI